MLRKWFGKKKEGEEGSELEQERERDVESEAGGEAPAAQEPSSGRRAGTGEPGEPAEAEAAAPEKGRWSFFSGALQKTRRGLRSLFGLRRQLDEALLSEIEKELYNADFGPSTVDGLMNGPDGVRKAWKDGRIERVEDVREFLRERLKAMLKKGGTALAAPPSPPCVILIAGVNGTGKTTSIAKLAKKLRDRGGTVILAAGDTFRAAAVEQLTVWSKRLGVEIVTGKPQADPASVAYRGAEVALEKQADYLIVDTAGRLHTQKNLMRELAKIRTILGKKVPGSPHESLLVLDATTGQNALQQARSFQEEIQVTGIILAKLDGTAKGGIAVTIAHTLDIPIKFVGTGETLDDLQPFDPDRFVEDLLAEPEE